MKICTMCKIEKLEAEFGKNKRMADGLHYACKLCSNESKKEWKHKNKDKVKQSSSNYYLKNKEKINIKNKKWKDKNKIKLLESGKKLYKEKKNIILENQKEYRKNNRPKLAAKAAKERALRGLASPKWLTDIHKMQIEWFYKAAKMMTETTNIAHHVDHIHPLQGEGFNGLHVPWNLQVLPATVNIRKSNKLAGA